MGLCRSIQAVTSEIHANRDTPTGTHILPFHLPFCTQVDVECVDENAGADVIRVYVCNPVSAIPIITALVNMPLADFLISQ